MQNELLINISNRRLVAELEDMTPEVQIHPTADVQTRAIGRGTRIWQFCVILPGAQIGEDCNICSHCLIENDVCVGNRVTVKSGVQLWDSITVHDDVFIGPNVTFTNDPYPRSKKQLANYPRTVIERGASIGANATIVPGLKIGRASLVAAGAVVTRDVPPHALVKGNPAMIAGYSDTLFGERPSLEQTADSAEVSQVTGVTIHKLPSFRDLRGDLLAVELEQEIPFPVRRIFYVSSVPSQHIRGEHAHRICHQLLTCLHGSVRVMADNAAERATFTLDSPGKALHISPMVWASQYQYTSDALLCVFASHPYDSADYIRDYEDYLLMRRTHPSPGLPTVA